MIGHFSFSEDTLPRAICVELSWSVDDSRQARIVVSKPTARGIREAGWASVGDHTTLESAVSYAAFLAMRTGKSLVLTGDPTVWPAEWGRLLAVARERAEAPGS